MKRQLGPILTVLVLLCAPVAFAQSYTDSPLSTSSTPADPSQPSTAGSPQISAQPTGSPDPSQPTSQSSSNGSYAVPVSSGDPSQMGSNNSSQMGSDTGAGGGDVQVGSDDSQAGQTSGPQATFLHPEELPGLDMLGESVAHTGIRMNVAAGNLAQYVSGYANNHSYLQDLTLLSGGFRIVQIHPTVNWVLGYDGGVSLTSGETSNFYTTLNQAANARIIWRLAKRWQLRAKDIFLYSDDPFTPYLTFESQPQPNDPNPIIYLPQSVVEQNQGSVDLTYQLGEHDSLDFSGGESFQKFLRGGATSLWDSFTYSGGGFYQHEFSTQLSAGGGYNFSALDFGHGQSRAGVNMFETFIAYRFSPHLNVSAWVGPELTNTKDLIPIYCTPYGCFIEEQHNSSLDIAEGGNIVYSTTRNAIRGLYSHRVTNGGGILGAVTYYQLSIGWQHSLSRVWNLNTAILGNKSTSISHYRSNQYQDSVGGTAGLSRKVGDAWLATMYYAFIHQKQNYYGGPSSLSNNGFGITLRYIWGHSLGR